jgi:glycosyltransferase involved in cell wall biosynthesis
VRVLQVHAGYRHPAGEDTVVASEAELLRAGGHEVLTWNTAKASFGRRIAALALSTWNPIAARSAQEVVAEFRPDVAHIHNTWYSLSPSVIAAIHHAGVPVVMTLHNYRLACVTGEMYRDAAVCTDCLQSSPLSGVRHGCYHNSHAASAMAGLGVATWKRTGVWHRYVDRFIAPSRFFADMVAQSGIPADRILVKSHFVSDPGPRDNPPSSSKRIIFVGRLAEAKGVRTLIQAWRRQPPAGMQLEIVGEGDLRAELERDAPPGVRFVGWLSHAASLRRLMKARALVFPSEWYEPFGMVLPEAMAAGLAVVGSDIAAVREITQPYEARQLVAPGSPEALAGALAMLGDDAFVDLAGDIARERYLATFTPERNLQLLTDIYQSVGA